MSDTASARRFGTTFFGRREDNASQGNLVRSEVAAVDLTKSLVRNPKTGKMVAPTRNFVASSDSPNFVRSLVKDKEFQFRLKASPAALAPIVQLIPVAPLLPIIVSAIMGFAGRECTA